MQMLIGYLPGELKSHVKEFQLRSGKNYNIIVPITPNFLRAIANTWTDNLKSYTTSRGKSLIIIPQRHPTVQKRYQVTGRLWISQRTTVMAKPLLGLSSTQTLKCLLRQINLHGWSTLER